MQVEIKETRSKCYQCMMPSSSCICEHINSFHTNTRFVILMHPKEYRKEKNGTGRMSKLQLQNSEIIVGIDFTSDKRINEILGNERNSSFLLYPGENSFNLSTRESSETISFLGKNPFIFILDGTWPCARKMLKRSENLQKLKRVSFDNKIKSKFIIKQQPASLCLSTIESIYTVLNLLNESGLEQSNTDDFLTPFEKMIEHQVTCMLNTNDTNINKKEMIPKDIYKKKWHRSISFKQKK